MGKRDRRGHDSDRQRDERRRLMGVSPAVGKVTGVRLEQGTGGQPAGAVVQSRRELDVPPELKVRIRGLHVKYNTVQDRNGKHVRSSVLVIAFREVQAGVCGWPETTAKQRKFARLSFSHVTIERLSGSAQEASLLEASRRYLLPGDFAEFRITWWRPKAGHRDPGEIGGEEVLCKYGDLAVLWWLSENRLLPLCEPQVASASFLPRSDPGREAAASCLRPPILREDVGQEVEA